MAHRKERSRPLRSVSVILSLAAVVSCADAAEPAQLVIANVTVMASPGAEPRPDVTLVIREGRLAEILEGTEREPPAEVRIDANGGFATAGFWNGHVHFTQSVWSDAASAQPEPLQDALDAMLNRFGFTSVLDTGSDLPNTLALRDRIDIGELRGPRIRTAGSGLVPPGGSPAYLEVSLPELDSPEAATQAVERVLSGGADAVKLFTGSFLGPGQTAEMPLDAATAAVASAHERGVIVIAHPQSEQGVRIALASGVNVLAHTAPNDGPWPPALVTQLVEAEIGLVPIVIFSSDPRTDPTELARPDRVIRSGVSVYELKDEVATAPE